MRSQSIRSWQEHGGRGRRRWRRWRQVLQGDSPAQGGDRPAAEGILCAGGKRSWRQQSPAEPSPASARMQRRRRQRAPTWQGQTPRMLMPSVCSTCCPPAPASSVYDLLTPAGWGREIICARVRRVPCPPAHGSARQSLQHPGMPPQALGTMLSGPAACRETVDATPGLLTRHWSGAWQVQKAPLADLARRA